MTQRKFAQVKRPFTWLAQQQAIELPEVLMLGNGGGFVCVSYLDSCEVYVLKTAEGHPLANQWRGPYAMNCCRV